ncbi:MAG TPA: helix-turn-helix domain-containing protein [Nonomuraea sp.]|nr:helix-turn-helix domain-containing protein [Nonomuraea sp.]
MSEASGLAPSARNRRARQAVPRETAAEPATEALDRRLVIGLVEAGRLLGMGRTTAYRLARTGRFPCPILRIGGRYAVPVRGLRALLGYRDEERRTHDEHEKGMTE